MKMVKNIAIVACAASFMFANVSFHMGNNYGSLDAAEPVTTTSYGASWGLNGTTSVGYDSHLGMLMSFSVGATSLRMGWNATSDNTSIGLGFTWWNGGDGLNTSISTNYDMRGVGDGSDGNVSMVVGFGF